MVKEWTRTNGQVRMEPIGNITAVVIYKTGSNDAPSCPECGQYNAMLNKFGWNDLVVCRNCGFLAHWEEEAQ